MLDEASKANAVFQLTFLIRKMQTDAQRRGPFETSTAGCISVVKWEQQMLMFHITRLPFLRPHTSSRRLVFRQTHC